MRKMNWRPQKEILNQEVNGQVVSGQVARYSLAIGYWKNFPTLACRWNSTKEHPTGFPSRGWFPFPSSFNRILEVAPLTDEILREEAKEFLDPHRPWTEEEIGALEPDVPEREGTSVQPEDVSSPEKIWKHKAVLIREGEGNYSLVMGQWAETPSLAIRWNRYCGNEYGFPVSRGRYPTWFQIPTEFNGILVESPEIPEHLREFAKEHLDTKAKANFIAWG